MPVPLPSHLPVGPLALDSVVAAGRAIAGSGGSAPDPLRIAAAYRSDRHLLIDGEAPEVWAPLSGFWQTSDGWVRTHGNYPHHAAALHLGLELPDGSTSADVLARLNTMTVSDAVSSISRAGGLCVPVRQQDPAYDEALRQHPIVEVERAGDAAPRALPHGTAARPLEGVRVLDLTRVIAGPVATRTLAFAGADVLRIDPPQRPEFAWQHFDTGHGKRTALLDIASEPERFEGLLAGADVVVLGYRADGLSRLGLSPGQLAARHPHLVIAQLSAWPGGHSPRGFDSLVQAESGIAWLESPDGGETPGALPAQGLDHSAGYLLAAGIVDALRRREGDGGTWVVRTSLRRIAAELLGMPRASEQREVGDPPSDPATQSFEVGGQTITTVAPAVSWPGGPTHFEPPRVWGSDLPVW
ncbi:CoA transferase [Microbacterium sp. H1-D42]|uniref:CoA transferase n=1 Tax=Microbacterium sp. H1-D42 TaxID=2925844 RepID=UPI001F53D793|nr:CoA transferase [Microbacterium sp. H1-D42]UNK72032.1 CoA transferase [Microbacterium sp. H1-D42]